MGRTVSALKSISEWTAEIWMEHVLSWFLYVSQEVHDIEQVCVHALHYQNYSLDFV
jgi:hypothetical protein